MSATASAQWDWSWPAPSLVSHHPHVGMSRCAPAVFHVPWLGWWDVPCMARPYPHTPEKSPQLLLHSPQGTVGPCSVLEMTRIKMQLFGANCFAHFCHNFCLHPHMFFIVLALYNHFYYPHVCIPFKQGLWTEPSAFLHATLNASWGFESKRCFLLEPGLLLILSVLHSYT